MLIKLLSKIFRSRNDRVLKKAQIIVDRIHALEHDYSNLNDMQLKNKTNHFRMQLLHGEKLNNILPKAFATVREVIKRIFGLNLFNVQLLGGVILNQFCVAEMKTGEGKTLTSTLPAYLNALSGKGVHIVTMNDYLAKRDAYQNTPLFNFLNLKVGLNLSGMSLKCKKQAYLSDITYGTNNEYGFDYLRDNMVLNPEDRVQRQLHYALIDEVDSILIDESRTPLIISSASENRSELYFKINKLIPHFIQQKNESSETSKDVGDFYINEKQREIYLTEQGLVKMEKLLIKEKLMKVNESLYSSENIALMNCVIASLRAHKLFIKNVDYIVKDNKIVIIDEHTGRLMEGRRWSDGVHQSIEAKERVKIKNESQTLASITFQNYFKLYDKLSGMTGTAITESFEFNQIYNLDTIVIPTNFPMIRQDLPDLVYMTEKEKINAVIKDIQRCMNNKQPVLVGTISIDKSEFISKKLKKLGIKHNVLNAKIHEQEARIIAEAGQMSAVTIATNMAGRGTDIVLGGSLECFTSSNNKKNIEDAKKEWKIQHDLVLSVGGLHIIGTERHESRRIDNQLRGRSGRQGDNGSSRFYLSMEDPLMRLFSSDRIIMMMRRLGVKENEAIQHKWITRAIFSAQKKIENRNFDIRKNLLDYDNIVNNQRCIIYQQRNQLIDSKNISKLIMEISFDVFSTITSIYIFNDILNKDCLYNLQRYIKNNFNINISILNDYDRNIVLSKSQVINYIVKKFRYHYKKKVRMIGLNNIQRIERLIMIQSLDFFWKEHLSSMDYLRNGIYLRGYAQKDPKQEYERESFIMFSKMLKNLKYKVISDLSFLCTSECIEK
ncbi:preprotein translocase subunit secA [Buchnera aphidicola (Nipponaphis monzeni)]|uniref:Protein translocase subunit SecA n=1 Tax=Buchnera aphidicola (Nipponaphis monzeni) TaxID=2495405 RepID=A0A455TA29_9GAMM|nr:preprotein translocase subunit SecA [Buchnera aphidicola]BBI01179.1 preprotein translocase subunit secA [Buchnera aphidicola (Nipponaphis monzeni)]